MQALNVDNSTKNRLRNERGSAILLAVAASVMVGLVATSGVVSYKNLKSHGIDSRLLTTKGVIQRQLVSYGLTPATYRSTILNGNNQQLMDCIVGNATPACNDGIEVPVTLYNPLQSSQQALTGLLSSTSDTQPARFDLYGNSCSALSRHCPFEVYASFVAHCVGASPCSRADSISVHYHLKSPTLAQMNSNVTLTSTSLTVIDIPASNPVPTLSILPPQPGSTSAYTQVMGLGGMTVSMVIAALKAEGFTNTKVLNAIQAANITNLAAAEAIANIGRTNRSLATKLATTIGAVMANNPNVNTNVLLALINDGITDSGTAVALATTAAQNGITNVDYLNALFNYDPDDADAIGQTLAQVIARDPNLTATQGLALINAGVENTDNALRALAAADQVGLTNPDMLDALLSTGVWDALSAAKMLQSVITNFPNTDAYIAQNLVNSGYDSTTANALLSALAQGNVTDDVVIQAVIAAPGIDNVAEAKLVAQVYAAVPNVNSDILGNIAYYGVTNPSTAITMATVYTNLGLGNQDSIVSGLVVAGITDPTVVAAVNNAITSMGLDDSDWWDAYNMTYASAMSGNTNPQSLAATLQGVQGVVNWYSLSQLTNFVGAGVSNTLVMDGMLDAGYADNASKVSAVNGAIQTAGITNQTLAYAAALEGVTDSAVATTYTNSLVTAGVLSSTTSANQQQAIMDGILQSGIAADSPAITSVAQAIIASNITSVSQIKSIFQTAMTSTSSALALVATDAAYNAAHNRTGGTASGSLTTIAANDASAAASTSSQTSSSSGSGSTSTTTTSVSSGSQGTVTVAVNSSGDGSSSSGAGSTSGASVNTCTTDCTTGVIAF